VKAVVYHNYGSPDVLRYEEIEKPSPGDNDVLVVVRAASVNPYDSHMIRAEPFLLRIAFGLRKPKHPRLGVDFAGRVEAVGSSVTRFKAGDEVFGAARGAFGEYVCAEDSRLAFKPQNVTFAQAASVPIAGVTALQALRDRGKLQPKQKVLINGAAGGIGTFAVQIAKAFGAHVVGVCSTRNLDLVLSIGADEVIDYTKEDFTKGASQYDVLLDCVSNHSLTACRHILKPEGEYVGVGGVGQPMMRIVTRLVSGAVMSPLVKKNLRPFGAKMNKDDLAVIAGMIESGKVTPVIESEYSFTQVADAIRHVETGHTRGKVVITVSKSS
jgi:NADPH:quinone reductase-like Zn-dependent oxidoreductase